MSDEAHRAAVAEVLRIAAERRAAARVVEQPAPGERFSREWFQQVMEPSDEKKGSVMCDRHRGTKRVATFVDEMTGAQVQACKKCAWRLGAIRGFERQ